MKGGGGGRGSQGGLRKDTKLHRDPIPGGSQPKHRRRDRKQHTVASRFRFSGMGINRRSKNPREMGGEGRGWSIVSLNMLRFREYLGPDSRVWCCSIPPLPTRERETFGSPTHTRLRAPNRGEALDCRRGGGGRKTLGREHRSDSCRAASHCGMT